MWAEQIAHFMRKTRDDIIPDETLTPRRAPLPPSMLFSQPQYQTISLKDMECPRSGANAESVYDGYVNDKYFPAQWYLVSVLSINYTTQQ